MTMANDGIVETVDREAEKGRMPFYKKARTESLAPLWRVLHGLVTEEPKTDAVPAIFEFDRVRPFLMEACEIIGTEEAERRVMGFAIGTHNSRWSRKVVETFFCISPVIVVC